MIVFTVTDSIGLVSRQFCVQDHFNEQIKLVQIKLFLERKMNMHLNKLSEFDAISLLHMKVLLYHQPPYLFLTFLKERVVAHHPLMIKKIN